MQIYGGRYNLGAMKVSIRHTSNENGARHGWFTSEGYKESAWLREAPKKKVSRSQDILYVEEIRAEYKNYWAPALDLALSWAHTGPSTPEEPTELAIANSPVLVGPGCPAGVEAAEKQILPKILETHTQHG